MWLLLYHVRVQNATLPVFWKECGAFRTAALKNLHKFLISERGQ